MDPAPTVNLAPKRAQMVWEQLVQRDIRDQGVLRAMGKVQRELFVPEDKVARAYDDSAIAIGHGQTISQPYMVALTLQALRLDRDDRVLEVGTGSGYMTAVLAEIVREVISMEIIPDLAKGAEERLRSQGYRNVTVVVGDGSLGHPSGAPFQRIAVAAGAPSVPHSLEDQLDEGGILVIPVGDRYHQSLRAVTRRRGDLLVEDICPCVYVPLVGEEGWDEGSDAGGGRWAEGL